MSDLRSVLDSAESALAASEFDAAVRAATVLVEAGEPWRLDGLLRRAMALEHWSAGPADRLALAASDWREMLGIAPAAVSFTGLGRVQLKMGDHDAALANFREAERLGAKSEAWVGLAECLMRASPPQTRMAHRYFFRAAVRGSTDGMRGYVDTAYALDRPFSAVAMILCAVITAPVFAVRRLWRRHRDG